MLEESPVLDAGLGLGRWEDCFGHQHVVARRKEGRNEWTCLCRLCERISAFLRRFCTQLMPVVGRRGAPNTNADTKVKLVVGSYSWLAILYDCNDYWMEYLLVVVSL